MASFTNYAWQQIHLKMKDGSGTIPTSYYAAMFKVTPALDGTGGTEVDSAVNTWYARQALTLGTPSLSGRSIANSAVSTFHASAPDAISGNIVSLGWYDASTSGNLWLIMPLTTPLTVGIGSLVSFPVGQLIHEGLTT